jgi:multidrug efflux pump subunit AcrA (membrane-fusion protein)
VKGRRLLWISAGLIVAGAAGGAIVLTRSRVSALAESGPVLPTVKVSRESLELSVHMNGDLRASRQQAVLAPAVGTTLRVLRLVETGTAVKAGDVIVEFDPADQRYALEQAESELLEAEQEIIKRRADTEAQNAQDSVALLTGQFNVRRAELDAAIDQDLIAANDYKIRQAQLAEARRTFAQTEQDIRSRATAGKAGLSVLDERRAKAQMTADRARQGIDSLVIKAPMDGVVSVRENTDAAGGIFFSGMTLPQYRIGDMVNPGRPVLDIFDVSGMEIRASVNEQERANVSPGQAATVRSNAVPGAPLGAKVIAVAGLGQPDRYAGPLRMFEVTLELDRADERLRPGTSVEVIVPGRRVDNVLVLPRQAVFEKDGKPVIYVRSGSQFTAREVKVLHRTESRVAIEGVDEGVEAALISPSAPSSTSPTPTASPLPGAAR